jgi:hypothetical protein
MRWETIGEGFSVSAKKTIATWDDERLELFLQPLAYTSYNSSTETQGELLCHSSENQILNT